MFQGKGALALAIGGALSLIAAGSVVAEEPAKLVVNGEIEMVTETEAPAHLDAFDTIYSGWTFRTPETRMLQMDDFDNPAMVFVDQAAEAWDTVDGAEGKSCASCHGDVAEGMAGVRAVYPKWNEDAGKVRTLVQQVNDCRETRMGAEPWKYDGGKMVAMESLISVQSRGMPVNVAIDGPAQSTWAQG